MTFTNQTNRVSVVGDGTTQEIPFSFPISDTSDLVVRSRLISTGVQSDPLTETSDYTVSISGDTGGTVTMVTTFDSTYQIHVIRNTPMTQNLNLEQGGSYNAEDIEDALDKSRKLGIENSDQIERTLKFTDTDPSSSIGDLPNSIDRASKNLTFDSDGKPTASVSVEEGNVSFSTIGTNIAEAADAATVRGLVRTEFDITAYGAKEATADNASAIQDTIDAAELVNGKVTMPEGDFGYATKLTIDDQISFVGVGKGSLLTFNGTGLAMSLESEGLIMKGFELVAGSGAHTNGISNANGASSLANSYFENVSATGFVNGAGLRLEDAWQISFVRCNFRNSDYGGILGDGVNNQTANDITFHSCNFNRNDTTQFKLEQGTAIGLFGGNYADDGDNGTIGIHLEGNVRGFVASNIYSEHCDKFVHISHTNVRGYNITGCRIATNTSTGIGIEIDGGQEGVVSGNSFLSCAEGVSFGDGSNVSRGLMLIKNYYDTTVTTARTIGSNAFNYTIVDSELFQTEDGYIAGSDGVARGQITLWDGASSNTPGYIKMHSPQGLAHFMYFDNEDRLRRYHSLPSSTQGEAIGTVTKTVEISSSEIKDLADTPITLVTAAGAGTLLEFVSALMIYDYGSAAYAEPSAPDDMVIEYESGVDVTAAIDATGFITETNDEVRLILPTWTATQDMISSVNDKLRLFNTGTDYTTGDGTLTVHITYRVHTLGLA